MIIVFSYFQAAGGSCITTPSRPCASLSFVAMKIILAVPISRRVAFLIFIVTGLFSMTDTFSHLQTPIPLLFPITTASSRTTMLRVINRGGSQASQETHIRVMEWLSGFELNRTCLARIKASFYMKFLAFKVMYIDF